MEQIEMESGWAWGSLHPVGGIYGAFEGQLGFQQAARWGAGVSPSSGSQSTSCRCGVFKAQGPRLGCVWRGWEAGGRQSPSTSPPGLGRSHGGHCDACASQAFTKVLR